MRSHPHICPHTVLPSSMLLGMSEILRRGRSPRGVAEIWSEIAHRIGAKLLIFRFCTSHEGCATLSKICRTSKVHFGQFCASTPFPMPPSRNSEIVNSSGRHFFGWVMKKGGTTEDTSCLVVPYCLLAFLAPYQASLQPAPPDTQHQQKLRCLASRLQSFGHATWKSVAWLLFITHPKVGVNVSKWKLFLKEKGLQTRNLSATWRQNQTHYSKGFTIT